MPKFPPLTAGVKAEERCRNMEEFKNIQNRLDLCIDVHTNLVHFQISKQQQIVKHKFDLHQLHISQTLLLETEKS